MKGPVKKRKELNENSGGSKEEKGEKDDEPRSKKSKAEVKLAMRQQIIGRKRMMRKKKTEARGRK